MERSEVSHAHSWPIRGATVGFNGIIQCAGMGFLFVPLSVTALATLAPE
jgi:hypothetical protein